MMNTKTALRKNNTGNNTKRFTTFSVAEKEYGLQIGIEGYMMLDHIYNGPSNIAGKIEINGQHVDIPDITKGSDGLEKSVNDDACIVLFRGGENDSRFEKGAMYSSVDEMLEMIRSKL
jgi:hypothetical protein